MGWDQSGTDDDLWFGMMVEKLGVAAVEELWPLDRPYEVPTVKVQVDRPDASAAASLVPIPGASPAFAAAHAAMSRVKSLGRSPSFGSNNWAVDGTKTKSGKPILCNDPHLGFRLPSIWYTCHLSVGDENVAGVTFPGSPIMVIGHNDHIAWGVTNLQADAVDYFVETVDPADPRRYKWRGQWKTTDETVEEIPIRGEAPHKLVIHSTVHGPVINREGRAISLCWTGLRPTRDMIAFWNVSRAGNLQQYLAALDDLGVPALNMCYADDAGNIAMHACGDLPLRMRGQGRIPLDGASGANDWAGMIPRAKLPLSINPPDHFVASANGRPTPIDYPLYLGWMWDCNYRIRRINDMLAGADGLTVDSMRAIQTDHYDKAAERFVPVLLDALARSAPSDPITARAADALQRWNYVASTDSIGTIIWLRWFAHYRRAVWDDEWASRGIEQPGGSWGFSGTNRREPMLEVLEYMTREVPSAVWFDDRTTSERETRDEILRRSFVAAVESLVKDFGDNPDKWQWGNINQLRIGSLTNMPELARGGGPVVGTDFTVNPGSGGGTVGGGASWRMIVDLARVEQSLGVYPGGQSENPESPHYTDQMPVWAALDYLSIHMIADRAKLRTIGKSHTLTLRP
jgi:penicillin amidase